MPYPAWPRGFLVPQLFCLTAPRGEVKVTLGVVLTEAVAASAEIHLPNMLQLHSWTKAPVEQGNVSPQLRCAA